MENESKACKNRKWKAPLKEIFWTFVYIFKRKSFVFEGFDSMNPFRFDPPSTSKYCFKKYTQFDKRK